MIKDLLDLLFADVDIEYSNINGKEKLIINGEEVLPAIKQQAEDFKKLVTELNDEVFEEFIETLEKENVDINAFDRALEAATDVEYLEANIKLAKEILSEIVDKNLRYFTHIKELI